MDIGKQELRVIIYFHWKKGLNPPLIAKEINAILGESTVTECTCQNWVTKFENNLFDIEDSSKW